MFNYSVTLLVVPPTVVAIPHNKAYRCTRSLDSDSPIPHVARTGPCCSLPRANERRTGSVGVSIGLGLGTPTVTYLYRCSRYG